MKKRIDRLSTSILLDCSIETRTQVTFHNEYYYSIIGSGERCGYLNGDYVGARDR